MIESGVNPPFTIGPDPVNRYIVEKEVKALIIWMKKKGINTYLTWPKNIFALGKSPAPSTFSRSFIFFGIDLNNPRIIRVENGTDNQTLTNIEEINESGLFIEKSIVNPVNSFKKENDP